MQLSEMKFNLSLNTYEVLIKDGEFALRTKLEALPLEELKALGKFHTNISAYRLKNTEKNKELIIEAIIKDANYMCDIGKSFRIKE